MRFNDLQSWLSWQENLHSSEIELGLERVQQVATAMAITPSWEIPVITVAGTNGKGSSVALLEAIYHHAGYRVGSYTSPHLIHYNERIKIDRQPVSDELICEAFERVDQARQLMTGKEISLTYFEFGTLAALSILNAADLDIVILEVGLGGRLDAVNIIDANIALITPVAIDHQSWLGNSREEIAAEKAGIIKQRIVVVCSDPAPATAVTEQAKKMAADLYCLDTDFKAKVSDDLSAGDWDYQSASLTLEHLPLPVLSGRYQLNNAAAAIQVAECLADRLAVDNTAIAAAMNDVQLAGRYQYLVHSPDVIVDVAHNQHAVSALANNLRQDSCTGRTLAVVAMLEDKAIAASLEEIDSEIDYYYLAGLEGGRALSVEQLKQRVQETVSSDKLGTEDSVDEAINQALAEAGTDDRIIIFGSFLTVAAALQSIEINRLQDLGT